MQYLEKVRFFGICLIGFIVSCENSSYLSDPTANTGSESTAPTPVDTERAEFDAAPSESADAVAQVPAPDPEGAETPSDPQFDVEVLPEGQLPAPNPGDDSGATRAQEMAHCSDLVGPTGQVVHVAGSQRSIQLGVDDVLALGVTGNQNRVNVSVAKPATAPALALHGTDKKPKTGSDGDEASEDGDDDEDSNTPAASPGSVADGVPTVRAICLFLRGNKAKVDVHVDGMGIRVVRYRARGNQPTLNLHLGLSGVSFVNEYDLDFGGNFGSLHIFGRDLAQCPATEAVHGSSSRIVCHEI